MKYCLYYWIIAPLRGRIRDNPDRKPALSVDVHAPSGKYELSVLCDASGEPELARCRIPDLEKEEIPATTLPLLHSLKEHLLSALRITYSTDVVFWQQAAAWSFFDEGKPYNVDLSIEEIGRAHFDSIQTRDFFTASYQFRETVRLFVDGIDRTIPLQYRFLSLYKILENRFRVRGKWNNKAFDEFLASYETQFRAKGFTACPAAALHGLRDSCAHIRTGKQREVLGVTHLNHKEAVRTEHALEILVSICVTVINQRVEGAFQLVSGATLAPSNPII